MGESEWFKRATLGDVCTMDMTKCPVCEPSGICEACDTVDGRVADVVAEYASTCDGCAELTLHEEMQMDPATQLGYCKKCVLKLPEEVRQLLLD